VKIPLTGGSSFTGLRFARSLAASGHNVVAPLKRRVSDYSDLRGQRVAELKPVVEVMDECPFGSSRFLDVAAARSWDVLCYHAAHVGDYRSPEFDVTGALAENTQKSTAGLNTLTRQGFGKLILTGSVFEQDEGAGAKPLRTFSPYGLSKGLNWQYVRFSCQIFGFPLGNLQGAFWKCASSAPRRGRRTRKAAWCSACRRKPSLAVPWRRSSRSARSPARSCYGSSRLDMLQRLRNPAFQVRWPFPPAHMSENDAKWPDFTPALLTEGSL
jgi:hypothetical protein